MLTEYAKKRAAWCITKIKEVFPEAKSCMFTVFTIGNIVDNVKYYTKTGHVYFDGLEMVVYNKLLDDITIIYKF